MVLPRVAPFVGWVKTRLNVAGVEFLSLMVCSVCDRFQGLHCPCPLLASQ